MPAKCLAVFLAFFIWQGAQNAYAAGASVPSLENRPDAPSRPRLKGRIKIGAGYDSFAGTQIEIDEDEPASISKVKQGSPLQKLHADAEYIIPAADAGGDFSLGMAAEQTRFTSVHDEDKTSLKAFFGPNYRVPGRPVILNGRIGNILRLKKDDFSRDTNFIQAGGIYERSSRLRLKAVYTFELNNAARDNRDGTASDFAVNIKHEWSAADKFEWAGRFRLEAANAGFESKRIYGGGIKYSHHFALAGVSGLFADLSGGAARFEYRHPSLNKADRGKTRADIDWQAGAGLGKEFGKKWLAEIGAGYFRKNSNISRNDRDSTRVLSSIARKF